jgi:hypothetical protein
VGVGDSGVGVGGICMTFNCVACALIFFHGMYIHTHTYTHTDTDTQGISVSRDCMGCA